MAVRIPPHCPVDVDVLNKQRHQQIQKEQELKQQAAVQWQLRDPRVTHRLRSNEGRQRWSRQTHGGAAPVRRRNKHNQSRTDSGESAPNIFFPWILRDHTTEDHSFCSPVSKASTIAEVSPHQSLQGWQSRATQLLSAGTPATSWHGRQLLWQPPMVSTNQQPLGLPSFSSMSHHVYLGHWGGKPEDKAQVKSVQLVATCYFVCPQG